MSKDVLTCENISFGYPRSKLILDNINITVKAGQCLGILGASGCGKSTFAQIVSGFKKPSSGSLKFCFQEEMPINDLLKFRQIQMVFQDPSSSLTPFYTPFKTLQELLKLHFPNTDASSDTNVVRHLEMFGLDQKLYFQKIQTLSGGEKQRVALARAFCLHPQLLILDEPISSCDPFLQKDILHLIKDKIRDQKLSVIVILHDLNHALFLADQICLFKDGKIDCLTSQDQFLANPPTEYSKMFIDAFN